MDSALGAGIIAIVHALPLVLYTRGLKNVAQPSVEEFIFHGLMSWTWRLWMVCYLLMVTNHISAEREKNAVKF